MPVVYLGLGSNLQPEANLRLGVRELDRRFDLQKVSSVYRNKPVGFDGDDFLNAVAVVNTPLPAAHVCRELEEIHDLSGRRRGSDAFVSRTLDIDLLFYGTEILEKHRVPRADVIEYSFVLGPMAEIAPDFVHPVTGKSMAQHWAEFDTESHPLALEPLILLNGAS
jgi:2-amino-4-hydroxy-6-hydroxymethyldihydropteridine diphosphokinase